jgi:hypothetical protein
MNEEKIGRKKEIRCRVCLLVKPREEMRKTSRGRTIRHCRSCRGSMRCGKCGEVKKDENFKVHSVRRQLLFDDGDIQRIPVCYACDSKMYCDKHAEYLKRVQQGKTIRDVIRCGMRRWRSISHKEGLGFDLSVDFLVGLWEKQQGMCYYTGKKLMTNRGGSEWDDASLDRMNPLDGYSIGNVVWTSRLVNTSKGRRSVNEFVSFCKKVMSHFGVNKE